MRRHSNISLNIHHDTGLSYRRTVPGMLCSQLMHTSTSERESQSPCGCTSQMQLESVPNWFRYSVIQSAISWQIERCFTKQVLLTRWEHQRL